MKKSKLFLTGLLIVTMLVVVLGRLPVRADDSPKHYTELTFPPIPEIQLPEYTRFKLDNGLSVYLMEDRELPLVGGRALFRTGSRFEGADKVGLARLTGAVMRTGGTSSHSPDELNQLLEQKAAAVETGIGTTLGSAGFSALSEDLEEVFGLFAEVVKEPVFAEEKLEFYKRQISGSISRRNDDAENIADREFSKLIYGEDSPYARTVEYETINNISREDLVEFYRRYFHPENTILGLVGDFDKEEMRQLIADKFGDWQPGNKEDIPTLQAVSQAKKGGIFVVEQPQLTQSYVEMGHLAGKLDNPDYAALTVLNGVLGGLSGRLFNNIRSREGLAYSVYGVWSPNYDYPGVFVTGGQTRSDATVPFIKAINEEIDRIKKEPISEEELAYAKESTLNSFIFNFEDPAQTLSRLMRYEYYGYPEDFIFRFRKGVEETTVADVQRVARTYLKPENMVTLVVGNLEAIEPPLSSLGSNIEVTAIDVTIPEPS